MEWMDHSLQMIRQYTLQQEIREWQLELCREWPTSWMYGQQRGAWHISPTNSKHDIKKRRKRNEEPMEIMLKNKIKPSKESTHFLGMRIDSRLNWEEHINKSRAKAKRALNTIKVVAGKKWEGDWKNLKQTVKCNMENKNRLRLPNIQYSFCSKTKETGQHS